MALERRSNPGIPKLTVILLVRRVRGLTSLYSMTRCNGTGLYQQGNDEGFGQPDNTKWKVYLTTVTTRSKYPSPCTFTNERGQVTSSGLTLLVPGTTPGPGMLER